MEFVEKSYAYDVREGILGNEKLYAGQKKISEMAKDAIADVSYNWIEKVNNGEVKSNIIVGARRTLQDWRRVVRR